MATAAKIAEYGRDRQRALEPGFMTHAELVSELETAAGGARYRAKARNRSGPLPESRR
jgi:hypothetical protein